MTLKVNGELMKAEPGQDGYAHITRSWKAGDLVELELPMPVRRVVAHEKIEANKRKVALMRGPVVYCLEGTDNKEIDVLQLILPRSSPLVVEHDAKLLSGVTIIRVQCQDGNANSFQISAIPYHGWSNRGKRPMTVWIKEAP